jgi:hypothetical protein
MRNKSVIIVVFAMLLAGGVVTAVAPDQKVSVSERRKLAAFPAFTWERLWDGSFFGDMEGYLTDQFVPRESWREAKALTDRYVFQRMDNHDIYVAQGHAASMEYPLDEESVEGFARKMDRIRALYFPDSKVYYALIPDKNYYLAPESGHLLLDYDKMETLLAERLEDMTYIRLFDVLSLNQYYTTDSHWRQETLENVTAALAEAMGLAGNPFPKGYTVGTVYPFRGVYAGQAALPMASETLRYLITDETKTARVYHGETGEQAPVYDLSKADSLDPYELFLSGGSPFVRMDNPLNSSGRELVIFRDSYASALAPVLLGGYSRITLIDIRYMTPAFIPSLMELKGQDVLILYSTTLVNQSGVLREPPAQ